MAVRLSDYLKKTYGEKIYRLSLTSGCSCPNRDGSIVSASGKRLYRGCAFCSEGGSGEFAAEGAADIDSQIEEAKARIMNKTDARRFVAYFQSFTNTYGDPERLKSLYKKAIERQDVAILSLGTRPDCLGPEIMDMLMELNAIKPVWVELGLQTIHEDTAGFINRGYELSVFEDAYGRLKDAGITVIVHVIFGLPGETKEDMLETVRYLAGLEPGLDGIKIQNLQILKGTELHEQYKDKIGDAVDKTDQLPREKNITVPGNGDLPPLHNFSMEEYTDLVAKAIALLPKETVVHRMTGDGPRKLLVAPLWSLDKKRVLNTLTAKTKDLFL